MPEMAPKPGQRPGRFGAVCAYVKNAAEVERHSSKLRHSNNKLRLLISKKLRNYK
jgi:hypothetical protein